MEKKINIRVNRGDEKVKNSEKVIVGDVKVLTDPTYVNKEEVIELSQEDLYAKELEIVLEEYIKFTKMYKAVSKQMLNPIKMKRNAGKIYNELTELSQHFNQIIETFKERANPPTDLLGIHDQLLDSLNYFEVYNNEFPNLMKSGNFKRINEVSKGLDQGHKGLKTVFLALEKREQEKN